MMDYMIYVLSSAGAAYIIGVSKLFSTIKHKILGKDPDKLIVYFFNCPKCLGFWIGLIFSLTFFSLPYNSFVLALTVSCFIHVMYLISAIGSRNQRQGCGCGKSSKQSK